MDARFTAPIGASVGQVFAAVDDLGTYPLWLSIVRSAWPAAAAPGDAGPAWTVEIGAKVGPFTSTKRLRMVRQVSEPDVAVRFSRRETDDRDHPDWTLTATLEGTGTGATVLSMHLHYGGIPGLPMLDVLLNQEARRAAGRLEERLRATRD